MNGLIVILLITMGATAILFVVAIIGTNHAERQREREEAEIAARRKAEAEAAKQARRIVRAKSRLNAQATAAEQLIKEAVAQSAQTPRK